MTQNKKKAHFEIVAEKLIEQLEQGTSPFQKPWADVGGLPYNPTTEKQYRGMNSIWLQMQRFSDPRWMTFRQAKANDWNVMKGSRGSTISYVKPFDDKPLKDENGKPVLDENGKVIKQRVKLDKPIITSAVVFNAEQIDGVPKLVVAADRKWEDMKRVEKIVNNSTVEVTHGGNSAYYNPIADMITMPEKEQFNNAAAYYSVLLHEMGHWTGHSTRLDRPMVARFGTEDYAKEELRAEIASLMIGGELNVGRDFGEHVSYVNSWVSILKDEPFELYRASADAQKIMDYILEFEHKRNIEQKQEASFMLQDNIAYKNDIYKVTALLPAKRIEVTVQSSGQILNLTPKDGLYTSLAKAMSQQQATDNTLSQKGPKIDHDENEADNSKGHKR